MSAPAPLLGNKQTSRISEYTPETRKLGATATELGRCIRRIHRDNLQPGCVQRFGDLLGQHLGFFSSDLSVGSVLEERANRRRYDGIDLVRINHLVHVTLRRTSPARWCFGLQDRRVHRKPKNERMTAITTMSPMR